MKHATSNEVTVTCEQLSDGTWVGTIDEDDLHAVLSEADVESRVTDEGIGPYEFWGQRGVHHSWEVSEVSGSCDVGLYLNFGEHEFEDDDAREAAEEQVWASLTIPNVRTSGTAEDDIEFDVNWEPSAPGPEVTFEAELG